MHMDVLTEVRKLKSMCRLYEDNRAIHGISKHAQGAVSRGSASKKRLERSFPDVSIEHLILELDRWELPNLLNKLNDQKLYISKHSDLDLPIHGRVPSAKFDQFNGSQEVVTSYDGQWSGDDYWVAGNNLSPPITFVMDIEYIKVLADSQYDLACAVEKFVVAREK